MAMFSGKRSVAAGGGTVLTSGGVSSNRSRFRVGVDTGTVCCCLIRLQPICFASNSSLCCRLLILLPSRLFRCLKVMSTARLLSSGNKLLSVALLASSLV